MKRISFMGLVVALIATMFTLVGLAPANAATDSEPTPVISINVSASGNAELTEKTASTLNTDAEGRTILGPVRNPVNKGALHWLKKDANKCPTVANQPRTDKALKKIEKTSFVKKGKAFKRFKKAVPSAKVKKLHHGKRKLTVRCFWVKVGGEYTDTGEDPNGNAHGLLNHVKGSRMLFDTYMGQTKAGRTEIVRRRGQVAAGSKVVGVGDCLNPKAEEVEFVPGQYVYVNTWGLLRHRIQGMLRQRLHVGGSGKVSKGGCEVAFTYDFETDGTLAFDQTFTAKTKAEAEGQAAKVATGINLSGSTKASIENQLRLSLMVAFSEQCDGVPPVTYSAPTASGNAKACVNPGEQNGIITASGTNPNNVAAPGTLVVGGKTKQFDSVGAGQTVTWDFSGFAPGTYNGSFTLGAPINKSATFQVTVEPCPVQEHKNPDAEIFFGEHAVDLYGTMPVFGRARAYDGATVTLGSPTVTPSDLGMISNWRPVSTERDGVTQCESGWVCYQGTFRVTKDGTPGTYVYGSMVAKATDNKGGEFTTQPKDFSVFYADHPDM